MKAAWAVGHVGSSASFAWLLSYVPVSGWLLWDRLIWDNWGNSTPCITSFIRLAQACSYGKAQEQGQPSPNMQALLKCLPCHILWHPTGSQHSHTGNSQIGRMLRHDKTRWGVGNCSIFTINLPWPLTHSDIWVLNCPPLYFLRTVMHDLN